MSKACLVDLTKCIGCRACQVACKQWHNLPPEPTRFQGTGGCYENPPALSAKTYTRITFHELVDQNGDLETCVFVKRQCMHCDDPACVAACPVTALRKSDDGPVTYDSYKCIGCRYCVLACPFGVPTADWDTPFPQIHKCDFCFDRIEEGEAPDKVNGIALDDAGSQARFAETQATPACMKVCPTGALKFGDRDELLKEAQERIAAEPTEYVKHVYGEKEVGGTNWLYISPVSFDKLNFRTDLPTRSIPDHSVWALKAVPAAVVGLGAVLGGIYWVTKRRDEVEAEHESTTNA
ncbi:MAG: 4Fe-4S dicluster domain-containing protein [Phycisphaerales bacterium]|nr:4Fe-4S dicluster domain-containing protein [Phycisphaerales bacterium]